MLAVIRDVSESTAMMRTCTGLPMGKATDSGATVVSLWNKKVQHNEGVRPRMKYAPSFSRRYDRLQVVIKLYLKTLVRDLKDHRMGQNTNLCVTELGDDRQG